jgi:hypothetical protein
VEKECTEAPATTLKMWITSEKTRAGKRAKVAGAAATAPPKNQRVGSTPTEAGAGPGLRWVSRGMAEKRLLYRARLPPKKSYEGWAECREACEAAAAGTRSLPSALISGKAKRGWLRCKASRAEAQTGHPCWRVGVVLWKYQC